MMRKKSPADRAMGTPKSIEKPQWRTTALALATAALLGVSTGASALALGPVTVQSALGEPLRAEIDVPEITPDEVGSLRANIATPAAFRTAGLEYNSALSAVKITLERRPNGRYFLRLASDRAITDPFVDLMLETSWASGRIMRDYTMLFDPPNLRQGAPLSAQTSPVAPAPRVAAAPAAAPAARTPAAPPAGGATSGPVASRQAASATKPTGDGKQVTVKSGDTAGKIAGANKPANISLDQMLVAMLRANPDAFIGGNVNRLRAGAVLDIPSAAQAEQTESAEASRTVVAQSRDFNEFRRRLAEGTPGTRISPAERQASGKVQAQVEDKKPGAASPDKLTLSKGAMQSKGNADQIARERAAQDSATRLAELNKNIADLNKLGTSTSAAPSGTASGAKPGIAVPVGTASAVKPAATGASAPVATASAAKVAAPLVPAPVAAANVAAAASSPSMAASASSVAASAPAAALSSAPSEAPASSPAAAASAAAPVTAAASAPKAASSSATMPKAAASKPRAGSPPVETGFVEDMLENPIVPATLGGVLALLLGFGFYRAQQRKKSAQVDSSFLESRLQPDSFFGASGGQRIDTNEGGATGSSMVYSPSQLDAAGDVDPVAEADVYLAYGRDLQAEEILKEAMRTSPQRVAIHSKLLEIYSKRRDTKAFEIVANEAHKLTRGEGPEWEHICELGQELDPSNALYRPGGQPAAAAGGAAAPAAAASGFTSTLATQPVLAAAPASDLDLDLDFSLGDDGPAAPPARANPAPVASVDVPASQPMPSLDMDFGAVEPAPAKPVAAAPARAEAPAAAVPDLLLDETPSAANVSLASTAPAPVADPGMIEFDLGALSLDLDTPAAKAVPPAAKTPTAAASAPAQDEAGSTGGFEDSGDSSDPLATKLALAEEFNAIGDPDGARSLAQEVLAEASGDLKSRAQRLLAEIS
jgi:pilus assembly protein FimV